MSETATACLVCPPDPSNPETALDWLPSENIRAVQLFLAVSTKTKVPKGFQVINLIAGYPAALARIESLAAVNKASETATTQASDSFALFSLWRLFVTHPEITRVALVRGETTVDLEVLSGAFSDLSVPFCTLAQDPSIILVDRGQECADLALLLALDTALSGAVYSQKGYLLQMLLEDAQRAARSSIMNGMDAALANINGAACFDVQPAKES